MSKHSDFYYIAKDQAQKALSKLKLYNSMNGLHDSGFDDLAKVVLLRQMLHEYYTSQLLTEEEFNELLEEVGIADVQAL